MRRSIFTKILVTIAAVLFITDVAMLALGFSSVQTTVRRAYVYYATAASTVAADLLAGVDLEKLRTDEQYADEYRPVLEDLCRTNDLEYLYIYTPDIENDTILFDMVIYGNNSQDSARAERVPGTVVPYVLTETEVCVWNGQQTENVEEIDNKYGHVMTAYSAVHDAAGNVTALAAADVSMDEAIASFLHRYRIMVAVVIVSFVFILVILAFLLKTRVLKPASLISTQMRQFATDRQSKFERIRIKGEDEFAQMADTFYQMTEEIDQYIKNINALTEEKHRREAEMNIAGKIQKGLLPGESFQAQGIQLKAVMIPAQDVGGDFYDYFCLDNDLFCTVIADVSGKGISAALFMASAVTVVRQYAKLGYSPSEILFYTNNTLCCSNPEQMFLTLFVGIYDSRTRRFTYANAGHNPPYLISDRLKKLEDSKGMAIGIFEDEAYGEREVKLKEGDAVFLYTDGVSEAVGRDKTFFGLDRLEQILDRRDQEQCVDAVLEGVKEFAQDTPQSDDITMLAFCPLPGFRLCVTAEQENLDAVQRFIVENGQFSRSLRKKLCLAVEEIFVNICSYGYENAGSENASGQEKGKVEIFMRISDQILVEFRDRGKAFDPLENMVDVENYDIDTQVGGLGRLLAFDMAEQVHYEYSNGSNILILIFKEESR